MKLDYHQTLIRKAASIARLAGFKVVVDDAKSTSSCYLYVGYPSPRGGLITVAALRISSHCIPGWRRGGWVKAADSHKFFDLRPRSKRYDMERVRKFVATFSKGTGK